MASTGRRLRSHPSRLVFLAAAAVAVALAPIPAAGDIMSYYADGKTTSGDGTYYWTTDWGQCSLVPRPPNASGRQGVALNARQWRELGESAFCGMCVTVDGSGVGRGADPIRGTYDAYVMDHCSSCTGGSWGGYGDLDFSDGGKDGRWDITWRAVPCPVAGPIEYVFVGSHKWYIKVRGGTRGHVWWGGGGGGVSGWGRGGGVLGGDAGGRRGASRTQYGAPPRTVSAHAASLLLTSSSSIRCAVLWLRCVGGATPPPPTSLPQSLPNHHPRPPALPPRPPQVQPRNLPVPVKEVYVNGWWAERSRDGFFIFNAGGGLDMPFKLETVDARGEVCASPSGAARCGGSGGGWLAGGGEGGVDAWSLVWVCVGVRVRAGDSTRGYTRRRHTPLGGRRRTPSAAAAQR